VYARRLSRYLIARRERLNERRSEWVVGGSRSRTERSLDPFSSRTLHRGRCVSDPLWHRSAQCKVILTYAQSSRRSAGATSIEVCPTPLREVLLVLRCIFVRQASQSAGALPPHVSQRRVHVPRHLVWIGSDRIKQFTKGQPQQQLHHPPSSRALTASAGETMTVAIPTPWGTGPTRPPWTLLSAYRRQRRGPTHVGSIGARDVRVYVADGGRQRLRC
jgi:hypothetical protein